ncbi:MAG TPA: TenA family protein [Trebonia sp.]|jgi:thiaminase/transcriptional activator TenA
MTEPAGTTDSASDTLRAVVRADWDAAVTHRFVRELYAGTLPTAALRRYLVQDYQFVDGFTALLGATVACADSAAARMVIARQLGMVAQEENTYFQRAFDALGVSGPERTAPGLLPPTAEFSGLMSEAAASLDYASCLTVLTVAEWLYLDWAQRAPRPLPSDPLAREWIEIHDNAAFRDWVGFLRGELDRTVPRLPVAARDRSGQLFARVTRLELRFFEAAYHGNAYS